MSTGDQICGVCGNWIANHKDQKPCNPFMINCSMCGFQHTLKRPATCPSCGCSWAWGWTEGIEFKNRPTTVDVIAIDNWQSGSKDIYKNKILLIKRVNDPFKDQWAIPGGFINYDEELETAAAIEFQEETGLSTLADSLSLLGVYSKVDRDERHCISHVYYTHCFQGKLNAGDDAKEAKWFDIEEVEKMKLAFDHSTIIRDLIIKKEW